MDINFYGALYATKYCLPEIEKNQGSVVGISSIAGYRGLPGRTGYSASKFALQGFLEVLIEKFNNSHEVSEDTWSNAKGKGGELLIDVNNLNVLDLYL